ncbi:terminase small subunit, partial [Clostridium botulinum]
AFADITDYVEFGQEEVPVMGASGPIVDEDGNQITKIVNTVKFKESPEIDGTIVSEVKQGKDGASIKLQDKMKALQWLSDRINLLSTETKIKIDNEKAKVQIARERLDYEKNKDNKSDKPIEISIKRKGED